ncbi:MAG: tol-pal system protein YbgF, partial [Deltaproteobacteria bacterium]|nr:tol-pal system protein YbgF [Deltaproteobacteria bacterium]
SGSRRWIIVIGCAAVWLAGCATTKQVLEEQVAGLEREVLQLKAERTNLNASIGGLDDKLLLYEKRAEKCSVQRHERSLEVVRLRPGDTAAMEPESEDQPIEQVPAADGKRPVLKMVGSSGYAPSTGASTTRRPVVPVGDGDNLGVVAAGSPGGSSGAIGGPMAGFQEAYRAFTNGALDEALVRFGKFFGENPGHGYADNAMFWRGECYLAKGKLFKAIGEYERLVRRFPSSEKRPSALYRIGFAYDKLGDLAKAKEYYFKVVDRHPGTDAARKASRRVAAIREAGSRNATLLPTSAER